MLGPYPAVGLPQVILRGAARGAWGGYLLSTLNGYLKLYFFLPDICWFAVLPNVPPPCSFDFFSHRPVTFPSYLSHLSIPSNFSVGYMKSYLPSRNENFSEQETHLNHEMDD